MEIKVGPIYCKSMSGLLAACSWMPRSTATPCGQSVFTLRDARLSTIQTGRLFSDIRSPLECSSSSASQQVSSFYLLTTCLRSQENNLCGSETDSTAPHKIPTHRGTLPMHKGRPCPIININHEEKYPWSHLSHPIPKVQGSFWNRRQKERKW